MMTIKTFEQLGKADFGWLQARHHFSFGNYYDPDNMGFGLLRVVNDDRVAAGSGFDPHPHKDMEIITYVREGEIRHMDNLGNEGVTKAGDVQVMSAGTGVAHAEYASETERTVLYQIWIIPNQKGVTPRWGAAEFPKEPVDGQLRLLVSGDASDKDALFIHADAKVWGGRLKKGSVLKQDFGPRAYVLDSSGELRVQGKDLRPGDGAALSEEGTLTLEAISDAEVVVIELAR